MTHRTRFVLGLAAGGLILVAAAAQTASAAPQTKPYQPTVPSAVVRPNMPSEATVFPPHHGTRPIGGDWWKIYPWSPYNAWKNPYWYPPYTPSYPYPPNQVYPYYPYPVVYPAAVRYTMPSYGGYWNSGYGMADYDAYADTGDGMAAANYSYAGLQALYGSNPNGAGSGSYGTGAATSSPGKDGSAAKQAQGAAASKGNPDQAAVTAETSKLLDAVGVPNDKGTVLYPLGLRVLQPQAENLDLLDRIETLLQVTASQQKNGNVSANLLQEANTAVDRLQQLLRNRQHNMMPDTYTQAERFLDKLRHGLKVLQPNAAVR
jgi:hypothetical protein